jgi:hypothetical protein
VGARTGSPLSIAKAVRALSGEADTRRRLGFRRPPPDGCLCRTARGQILGLERKRLVSRITPAQPKQGSARSDSSRGIAMCHRDEVSGAGRAPLVWPTRDTAASGSLFAP